MSIKRYGSLDGMVESDTGEYVKHEDYEDLREYLEDLALMVLDEVCGPAVHPSETEEFAREVLRKFMPGYKG